MSPQAKEASQETLDRPEGWRPEAGDEIIGTIRDVSVATSTQKNNAGDYPSYPLLLIKKEGGEEVFVHCFHQTLQRGILESRPEIGHRIRIKFHGKQTLKSDSSRSVAVYSLELPDTPKSAASVYDRLEKAPTRQSAPQAVPESDVPWAEGGDDFLDS